MHGNVHMCLHLQMMEVLASCFPAGVLEAVQVLLLAGTLRLATAEVQGAQQPARECECSRLWYVAAHGLLHDVPMPIGCCASALSAIVLPMSLLVCCTIEQMPAVLIKYLVTPLLHAAMTT